MIVEQALSRATRYLERHGLEHPRQDSELMLASVLGKDRSFLHAHPEFVLEEGTWTQFESWLEKRADRYPIQYLRGTQEFYGRDFLVQPGVLIPRPETELLVDAGLCYLRENGLAEASGLDIGTGSGCLAVTLCCEHPGLRMTATDLSDICLRIALQNATRLGCSDRIDLVKADILPPERPRPFDLILSNPPYVSRSDWRLVDVSVLRHEPPEAVFGEAGGLAMFERIFSITAPCLSDRGRLLLEMGAGQAAAVVEAGRLHNWVLEHTLRDLSGIDRCAVFFLHSKDAA